MEIQNQQRGERGEREKKIEIEQRSLLGKEERKNRLDKKNKTICVKKRKDEGDWGKMKKKRKRR